MIQTWYSRLDRPRKASPYRPGCLATASLTMVRSETGGCVARPRRALTERKRHELSSGTSRITSLPLDRMDEEGTDDLVLVADAMGLGLEALFALLRGTDGVVEGVVDWTTSTSPCESMADTGDSSSAASGFGGKPLRTAHGAAEHVRAQDSVKVNKSETCALSVAAEGERGGRVHLQVGHAVAGAHSQLHVAGVATGGGGVSTAICARRIGRPRLQPTRAAAADGSDCARARGSRAVVVRARVRARAAAAASPRTPRALRRCARECRAPCRRVVREHRRAAVMRLLPAAVLLALLPCRLCFESLIQAQGELRKDRPVRPLRFATPDWNLYHRTSHLVKALLATAQSCERFAVTPFIIEPALSLTPDQPPKSIPVSADSHLPPPGDEGLLYFTVRSRPSPRFSLRAQPTPTARSVFVFGEEGRDLLTSEISLRVLTKLCANGTSQLSLPPQVELILVPVANPDGRTIAEMGRRCDRTNANDVELDRNWPSFWRFEEDQPQDAAKTKVSAIRAAVSRRFSRRDAGADDVASPISGTHPFSEPESRALRNLVFLVRPASYVTIRTGEPAITLPWDCKDEPLSGEQSTRLSQVMKSVNAAHCSRCKSGSLSNVTGAIKCGTSMDYIYGTMRVPFVYSWHVYDAEAPQGDCFRKHNPVNQAGYDRVTNNWAGAVLNFSVAVHTWMRLESEHGLHVAEQNASLAAAEATVWRAQAIAEGMPDPESADSDDGTNSEESAGTQKSSMAKDREENRSELRDDKAASLNAGGKNPVLPREEVDGRTKHNEQKASDSDDEETHFRFLTGWAGAWASLGMLSLALFVAKRYFFADRGKGYKFRSRGPRLPGKRA
ncbi:Zinc carboxypeptidase [Gracilaria domingensis]|nr:Zinc carboxypeptidase [Gracilaria domingensis]